MTFGEVAAYVLCIGLVLFLCLIFLKPIKSFLLFGVQSLFGGVGLYIVNYALGLVGISVGVNIATASVCGVLGIPGMILLILLKIVTGK